MSEFQYYEWQSVDRLLSPSERKAVEGLSSHIEVSPGKAVVTYNWSSFRHDPKDVLLQYFDGFFYYANWGSLSLMFRFPKGLLDEEAVQLYCDGDFLSFQTIGNYQVLDVEYNSEDGGWFEEPAAGLSDLIGLRAELIEGDYRLLYLAWLKQVSENGLPDDGAEDDDAAEDYIEPPVPPGLKKLTAAQQSFMGLFDLDPYLVQAAAENSPNPIQEKALNYRDLVAQLTRAECDDFLVRLAQGDASAALSLRKRLGEFVPKANPKPAMPRHYRQLLGRAAQLADAEKIRQAEEDRRKHIAEMKSLERREPDMWREVELVLDQGARIAAVYEKATGLLEQLKDLAEYKNTLIEFQTCLDHLIEKYASRPSLVKRWEKLR